MSDKAPEILIQKTPIGLMPYGIHSGPMIDDLVMGQVFTAKPRKNRKPPRNSAYWAGLGVAVKATEAWPRSEHLHESLKRLCGYVDWYHNPLTGLDEIRTQSTAFDKMDESAFKIYFEHAQKRFIEKMDFDPWKRERVA